MPIHLSQRKSPRLQGYNYADEGAYFVTIATMKRQHLFGKVVDSEMRLSALGKVVQARWVAIPDHHAHVALDAFVVMPNHVHGIVIITKSTIGTKPTSSASNTNNINSDNAGVVPTLGTVIGSYKSSVTRVARQEGIIDSSPWQTRYHDHIIRDERGLNTIRAYVATNPSRWQADSLFTTNDP